MNYLYYQRKINDVIIKCPIEAGIEILVYNLLDECIGMDEYALVDINRVRKDQDSRLSTEAGISDIAVLSNDFVFEQEDAGKVYGFIEVKAAGNSLKETEQVEGQMGKVPHFIYTNGVVWKYFYNQKLQWEKNLRAGKNLKTDLEIAIDENEFQELKKEILSIKWK